MRRILVSDIFGRTEALDKLAESLPGSIEIFDPYESRYMGFDSEVSAYEFFTSEVGLPGYAEQLKVFLSHLDGDISLIGFSMGGAAIWNISGGRITNNCRILGALCFYSAQIRHSVEIRPSFPIQLVFPSSENHFSVPKLINQLSGNEQLSIHQAKYQHGFMNKLSANFDDSGYEKYCGVLDNLPHDKSSHMADFSHL